VQLIQSADNRTIELQQAAVDLKVQKRRIYDITNVLEGIGYVEKLGKNVMRWVGGDSNEELEREANALEERKIGFEEREKELSAEIDALTS
jgi:transcription factor E2F3